MIRSLPQLFSIAPTSEVRAPSGETLYAIGDLHGRADLLALLMERIRSDRRGKQDRAELIFLGNYIGRGPDSDVVIDLILDLQDDPDFSVTALKGNHELVALQFLSDPSVGNFWFHLGGRETLLSYGIRAPADLSDPEQSEAIRQAFKAALPQSHLSFLERLSNYAVRGSYVFVHAGLRPGVRLARQREDDMLWIRNEFLNYGGRFEKVVVHGHTPEDEPFIGANRMGIDTGADVTNRLTGLKLVGAEGKLISVSSAPARFPRAAERRAPPVPRSLPAEPSPTPPLVPSVRAGGNAPVPWWRAWPTQTRISAALSAGLVALVGVGYLVVPVTNRQPLVGAPAPAQPRNDQPAVVPDVIPAKSTIMTEGRQTESAVAAVPPVANPLPQSGAEASGTAASEPDPPAPVTARPLPDQPAPETRTAVAATRPPDRTSATTRDADQPARPVEIADRAVLERPTPRDTSARKPAPAAKKQSDPIRAAPSTSSQPSSIQQDPEPRPRALARASRAPGPGGALPAGETALSARSATQIANGEVAQTASLNPRASREPSVAYIEPVPIAAANRIKPEDYPASSVRAGEEGVVGVRYVVGTNGRVSACAATEPSKFVRLDKRTCELIGRRFRFKPAIRDGRPVEHVREQRVRWTLCNEKAAWSTAGRRDQSGNRPCPA